MYHTEFPNLHHPPPPPSPPPPPPPSPPPPGYINWPLPSGFKFRPSDKELVVDYLDKKIKNLPLPCDFVINEVMLYHYTPDHLAAVYEDIGDNEWYFFTPRDRKYKLGKRPNRSITGRDGYWKPSTVGKPVMDEGVVVGFNKLLVFYRGSQTSGSSLKTKWRMNEYLMDSSQRPVIGKADESSSSMRLDWALCRVYNKNYKKGGALPSCISPQQSLSSASPPQKGSDFAPASSDFSQTSPMYNEDYKKEGASTIFPQLISSELPPKWSDSAPTSGDFNQTAPIYYEDCKNGGTSTTFPQLMSSELPQKWSDFAPTSGNCSQTSPMYYKDYKKEAASTISPQLLLSELPQKWSDFPSPSGNFSQRSPMYYDDYKKEGSPTIFPRLISSELPQKWSDSAPTSDDFSQTSPMYYEDCKKGGVSTTFPQLISSELPQKWSDSAPANGDFSQTSPMYSEDCRKNCVSTTFPQLVPSELPQKWSDFACSSRDFSQTSPMYYDDYKKEAAPTIFPQLIPSELPQKCSDSACTSGDFKQPGPPTPPRVLDCGGGQEVIDTKEEIKSNDLMRAPEPVLVSASSDTEKEMLWLEELNQLFQWSPPKMCDF